MLKLIIYFFLIIISSIVFGPKGPVIFTLVSSIVLLIRLSGIELRPKSSETISRLTNFSSIVTIWGPFIIYHSHHSEYACFNGKEFRIRDKFFCTGCYGGFFGIIFAITFMSLYLTYDVEQVLAIIMALSSPFCFIPIILRYTFITKMKTIPRFLSNMLLPIGCSIILILTDFAFQNWLLNGLVIYLIISMAYLRNFASMRENKINFIPHDEKRS